MNKTVTINISGIIFHIEEDAYDTLSRYLSTIKGYFSNTDGGNEIMSDIEARIAELLQEKISVSKQVVLMNDVEHVMHIMGKPEEFGAEPDKEKEKSEQEIPYTHEKIKRRLFRNPDEKAIGGVCSGLAAYFDIDTVWVRLAMFLLVFFGGISLWVYVILWIIIPLAKTTADKFAMRGESANINNILKSFKEEADDVKNRFHKYGKEFKESDYSTSVRNNASRVLGGFLNIIVRLIGLFILVIGTILLVAYITTLFGISFADSNIGIEKWKLMIFESSSVYALAIFSFLVIFGVPIFMLIYGGIKLLFRIHYTNRWLNLSLGILWATGLVIGFYTTAITLKQFGESTRLKETVELQGMGDTLVVKLNPSLINLKAMSIQDEDEVESYLNHNRNSYYLGETDKDLRIIGYVNLDVVENTTDSVELIVSKTARGNSKKDANKNAKAIRYAYSQNKNELVFDEIFNVAPGEKFRVQELDLKIKLPKGKVIYFDKSIKNILDDVDNTSNTSVVDMVDRRWIMTDKGLKCIDCQDLDTDSNMSEDNDEIKAGNVTINKKGISVNSNESEIKIDEEGIRIKTPGKNLEVKNKSKKEN